MASRRATPGPRSATSSRARHPALQVADGAPAQLRSLRQLLLREARRHPVAAQHGAKRSLLRCLWRLWAYVGRDEFPAYHRAWWFGWRGIQPVVFPLGILATLGSFAQLRWRPARVPAWTAWLGVGLWVATWGSIAAW